MPVPFSSPKKGPTRPGQAARGSGALGGFVDIIVEMQALSRRPGDRRRLLRSFSRHPATPPSLAIEWTPDGTDYRSLGTSAELDFEHAWPVLHSVLEQSDGALTRRQLLRRWPEASLAPSKQALWKWLARAADEGRVLHDGKGTRRDPFRYYLPGMLQKWQERMIAKLMRRLDGAEESAPRLAPEVGVSEACSAAQAVSAVDVDPDPSAAPELPPAPPPATEVCLPYPFNMMNPADVPEEVRQRARAEHRGGLSGADRFGGVAT